MRGIPNLISSAKGLHSTSACYKPEQTLRRLSKGKHTIRFSNASDGLPDFTGAWQLSTSWRLVTERG